MRWRLLVLLCAGCDGSSFRGDVRCEADSDCPGARCVTVDHVLVSTGACLESFGAKVCRPVCADCAQARPCGCRCP